MELALKKEINKEYIEAVKLYEEELKSNSNPSIDAYINLAFLYWEFAAEQMEFNEPNNIPDKWSEIGGKRFPEIIELAIQKYPRNVELYFLKRYFSHNLIYDDFTQEECEEIAGKYGDNESLVPYFFLYLFDQEKYQKKRDELLEECKKLATAKNLYILSFN